VIANAPQLRELLPLFKSVDRVAIDTEADSLHCYREKLCLLQISTPQGDAIVDPLADPGRRDPKRVYFGAWVQIESGAGELRWHRIVGPDEFDMNGRYVSMDSPLGRSLLGKRLDDEVSVELPGGAATFTVAAISYSLKPPDCS